MSGAAEVRDPARIRRALERDPFLHLYELGDLDPFFWPRTRWFASGPPDGEVIALLYRSDSVPVLLLFDRVTRRAREILEEIRDELPSPLYAHLSPGVGAALDAAYAVRSSGLFRKMSLRAPERIGGAISGAAAAAGWRIGPLGPSDHAELRSLYEAAYPGNWFEARMLETGRYFGLREGGILVSVAGVHVYSPTERIGVLGNVATHPGHRGRGLARETCRVLCQALLDEGLRVGLNVAQGNRAAIRCYESLGFAWEADYEERSLVRRSQVSRESE